MRLVSFTHAGRDAIGALVGDRILDLSRYAGSGGHSSEVAAALAAADLLALVRAGGPALDVVRQIVARAEGSGTPTLAVADARLRAPLIRPRRILGVGRNYRAHANEAGVEAQEKPRMFVKLSTSVVGPGDVVPKPAAVTKLDYEVELAIVIGRPARDVAPARALDHVFGYTIVNDVSAREFQFDVKPPQTSFAKSMDGFCPMGPCIVTADAIRHDAARLRCWINDEPVQDDNTSEMIFDVPTIIAHVSRFVALEPGDVIATGTPSGVGCFRKPPVYLQPGDRMRLEIDGIGTLENAIG
jgi:2-keto-4-pentenoate hydratase/2-oxohepta-3-ene-1,7-dioic acid hydratase in catechol pathway